MCLWAGEKMKWDKGSCFEVSHIQKRFQGRKGKTSRKGWRGVGLGQPQRGRSGITTKREKKEREHLKRGDAQLKKRKGDEIERVFQTRATFTRRGGGNGRQSRRERRNRKGKENRAKSKRVEDRRVRRKVMLLA